MPHGSLEKFNDALTRSEARLIAGLTTPVRIQELLDSIQYTRPLDLRSFDRIDWTVRDAALDAIGEKLDEIRKFRVLTPGMIRNLSFADKRSVQAGLLGSRADGLFKPLLEK